MLLISESKNMFKKEWGNKRNILRMYYLYGRYTQGFYNKTCITGHTLVRTD